jgi:hypothetical protein
VILLALISLILAEFINTVPPVTVNGAIDPEPVLFTTWNLSASIIKLDDCALAAALNPETLLPETTLRTY